MAMTYEPKIEAVQDGRCTQTIRSMRKKEIKAGDSILFHGWSGKAYRSEWNNKMRVTVTGVVHFHASIGGLKFENNNNLIPWDDILIDILAMNDFIDPPSGTALRDVLFKLNGAPSTPVKYQIIRWEVDWVATDELRKAAVK